MSVLRELLQVCVLGRVGDQGRKLGAGEQVSRIMGQKLVLKPQASPFLYESQARVVASSWTSQLSQAPKTSACAGLGSRGAEEFLGYLLIIRL